MGRWFWKVKIKLNSTQVVLEVEVRVELGKNIKMALKIPTNSAPF